MFPLSLAPEDGAQGLVYVRHVCDAPGNGLNSWTSTSLAKGTTKRGSQERGSIGRIYHMFPT